jgi:hypothetical protein
MFWQSGTPSAKWCYGSLPREGTASRLTTPLFISTINVAFTLEGEMLIAVWYFQSQTAG